MHVCLATQCDAMRPQIDEAGFVALIGVVPGACGAYGVKWLKVTMMLSTTTMILVQTVSNFCPILLHHRYDQEVFATQQQYERCLPRRSKEREHRETAIT